jgi:hypothetical protein
MRADAPYKSIEDIRDAAKDPAFLEETKKKKLDLDPSSGEEVETLVKEVMSQPADVVERLKKLMGR